MVGSMWMRGPLKALSALLSTLQAHKVARDIKSKPRNGDLASEL